MQNEDKQVQGNDIFFLPGIENSNISNYLFLSNHIMPTHYG